MLETDRLAWLDQPVAQAMLAFNFLPTVSCHPSQRAPWLPPSSRETRYLHRQASGALLGGLGLVEDLEDPALPVFMAEEDTFERLLTYAGLMLLSPSIRQVIVRDEIQALQAAFGVRGLAFARRMAPALWPDPAGSPLPLSGDVRAQALMLGSAFLYRVAEQASAPVFHRAVLRLPVDAQQCTASLPEEPIDAAVALEAVRAILQELDPQWLSLFPPG